MGNPPGDFGDGGGLGAARCSTVEEGGVPTGGGTGAGEEVAGFRLKEHGLNGPENGADPVVGVAEPLGDEVRAGDLSGGRGIDGGWGVRGRTFEGK